MKMKRLMWGCIVIVATGLLAGCGSGGGTSLMVDGQRATQALIDALAADAKTANDALAAVRTALDVDDNADIQGAITSLETQVSDANMKLTNAATALGTASTGDLIADIQALYTGANTSKTTLMAVQTALGADSTSEADLTAAVTNLETKRDDYKRMVDNAKTSLAATLGDDATGDFATDLAAALKALQDDKDALADARRTAKIKAAQAISSAINGNRVGTADRRRTQADGTTALTNDNNDNNDTHLPFAATGVKAERGTDGMVKVEVTATTSSDDEFNMPTVSAGDKWTQATLTRKLTGTTKGTETIMLYTDIAAPEAKAISTLLTLGALTITDPDSDDNKKYIMPAVLPTGDAKLSYDNNDTFKGTYRGVAGTYTCTASECEVSLVDKKPVINDGSSLSFSPTNSAATYNDPDTGYLYFGAWMQKATSSSGDTYMVESFSGSIGTAAASTIPVAFTGTAKYVGKAAGMFAAKTFTAGALTDANYGNFSATATLTADFGANDAAGNISGRVDEFMTDNTQVDVSKWEVKLDEASLTGDSALFNGDTNVSFAEGASMSDKGKWQGSFYEVNDVNDNNTVDDKEYPLSVAGTFDVHTEAAQITGGFGAHKQ